MKRAYLPLAIIMAASIGLCGCGSTTETGDNTSTETAETAGKGTTEQADLTIDNGVSDSAQSAGLSSFSAQTLDGDTVDQSIFADYDLTMINVWTTWCPYCINEMPDLEELYKGLPENVNLISICADADTESELAGQEVSDNGLTYQTLVINDDLKTALEYLVTGYPTTIFVDSKGYLAGAAQTGVPRGTSTADAYMSLINDRIASLGK